MADPNHVVLRQHRLVFMLPCKVGNTSIKAALADSLGQARGRLHTEQRWHHLGPEAIAELGQGWLVAGFVRHPYARFIAAWRHKLRDEGQWHRVGFERMPALDEVAEALPRITDQHWRALADDLMYAGAMLPEVIVRVEDIRQGWDRLAKRVRQHCGLRLASLPWLNATEGDETLSDHAKPLIAAHYRRDFMLFGYEP